MNALTFRFLFLAFAAFVFAESAAAQSPTAAQLKSWIAIRKQRVDLLRDEIKQTDARLESRLDILVATLESVTDSKTPAPGSRR